MNPQDGFDDDGVDRVPMFAPASVAEGGRVQRVEPSTRVDAWLVAVFAIAFGKSATNASGGRWRI
jgi:hypothetical protein